MSTDVQLAQQILSLLPDRKPFQDIRKLATSIAYASAKRKVLDDLQPAKRKATSFATFAAIYLDSEIVLPKVELVNPTVYTDGACQANGQEGAKAGIGIYWGVDHPLNVAAKLVGKQTNNRAELAACLGALLQAKDLGCMALTLCTDSAYTINAVTIYSKAWKRNGWIKADGTEPLNLDLIRPLYELDFDMCVTWQHVNGHVGIEGNEAADKLAVAGAQM